MQNASSSPEIAWKSELTFNLQKHSKKSRGNGLPHFPSPLLPSLSLPSPLLPFLPLPPSLPPPSLSFPSHSLTSSPSSPPLSFPPSRPPHLRSAFSEDPRWTSPGDPPCVTSGDPRGTHQTGELPREPPSRPWTRDRTPGLSRG